MGDLQEFQGLMDRDFVSLRDVPGMALSSAEAWDNLERIFGLFDSAITMECGAGSAWSGTLRLTLTDPEGAPSRGITFHTVGQPDPVHVATFLYADAREWLAESDVRPMPVPDWLKQ